MIRKKSALIGAALSGLIMTAGCASMDGSTGGTQVAMGQCHGVNSCKGKGECKTAVSSCEGKNDCKGKGWITMSKSECEVMPKATWMYPPEKEEADYYSR